MLLRVEARNKLCILFPPCTTLVCPELNNRLHSPPPFCLVSCVFVTTEFQTVCQLSTSALHFHSCQVFDHLCPLSEPPAALQAGPLPTRLLPGISLHLIADWNSCFLVLPSFSVFFLVLGEWFRYNGPHPWAILRMTQRTLKC